MEKVKGISFNLRNSQPFRNVDIEKKRIAGISTRQFKEARDKVDDYVQYLQCIRMLDNGIKVEGPQNLRKRLACQDYSDESILKLPQFFRFLNRCTVKLAEMDGLSSGALSHAHHFVEPKHSDLRFLDLCGGPGGFVEYLLMIHKWECKGVGITLDGPLRYQKERFHSNAYSETFLPLHGNLFDEKTLVQLKDIAQKHFPDGFDLILADGAADIDGKEADQESNSLPLLLQQVFITFQYLAFRGTLLLKCFDITLPSSLNMVLLLQQSFSKVTPLKTELSRASNSERYLLCQGYVSQTWRTLSLKELQKMVNEGPTIQGSIEDNLEKIRLHQLKTWDVQAKALHSLLDNKSLPQQIKPKQEDVTLTLTRISRYWRSWNLLWTHGVRRMIPFSLFTLSTNKCVPLFDNWNSLYHDTKHLSELQQLANSPGRLIYISENRLLDNNLQVIHVGITDTNLLSLMQYPSGTVVLVTEQSQLQNIMALPSYPKLFLKPLEERQKQWARLTNNMQWWNS